MMDTPRISRRSLATLLAAPLLPRRASAAPKHLVPPSDLRLMDWIFPGEKPFVKRATILVPTHLLEGQKVPCVILFHGLGEAKEGHESGAYAWLDRYGLGSCYARLRRPPVSSILRRKDLTDARAVELSEELQQKPLGGLVLLCPFTPNVWSFRDISGALSSLVEFVTGDLLERVSREIPVADTGRLGVDGCSLGGFVALEVFSRKPAVFSSVGVVQPAIGHRQIEGYVEAIRKRPWLPVHVESSTSDPYLQVSKNLHTALRKVGVASEFLAPPGLHDQPFLRDVGTLEMLLWHDRALRLPK
ncbi:MAG: alpha/beta hydrolase [Myxococcales bacterium]|nr:alpha/beta hydrolase [Polyangiaceae bacterium]MDW8251010.1 alpha/beta hydrolase [Myxococcales bacterium]